LTMPSARLKGVSGKVTDRNLGGKVKRLQALLVVDYRIIIENDTLTVEADLRDRSLKMKVVKILAE
jgi:hypothetical protein